MAAKCHGETYILGLLLRRFADIMVTQRHAWRQYTAICDIHTSTIYVTWPILTDRNVFVCQQNQQNKSSLQCHWLISSTNWSRDVISGCVYTSSYCISYCYFCLLMMLPSGPTTPPHGRTLFPLSPLYSPRALLPSPWRGFRAMTPKFVFRRSNIYN